MGFLRHVFGRSAGSSAFRVRDFTSVPGGWVDIVGERVTR
jgi:hypothetical protein